MNIKLLNNKRMQTFGSIEGREGEEKSFNYLYVWFKRGDENWKGKK
jgi:hypothetical protein